MTDDQVAVDEQNESANADNREATETKEQSSEAESTAKSEERTFKDSFGNEYTAEEFQEKFNEIQSSFTKKAQEAAEYRKKVEMQSESDARKSVNENDSLKNVPSDVKEAIISIVKPLLEEDRMRVKEQEEQRSANESFTKELDSLEKEFDGKNGKPKFNRNEVLRSMKEPGNRIYDPRVKFMTMHQDHFNDLLVKEALKKQRGGVETEDTHGDNSKPDPKTPHTFEEARKAAYSRISQ